MSKAKRKLTERQDHAEIRLADHKTQKRTVVLGSVDMSLSRGVDECGPTSHDTNRLTYHVEAYRSLLGKLVGWCACFQISGFSREEAPKTKGTIHV